MLVGCGGMDSTSVAVGHQSFVSFLGLLQYLGTNYWENCEPNALLGVRDWRLCYSTKQKEASQNRVSLVIVFGLLNVNAKQ